MIQKWNKIRHTPEQEAQGKRLAEALNIHPLFGIALITRGIDSEEKARAFFKPQLHDLHDPFLMNDMDLAVKRLNSAMGNKERILVYGDYDVDGTTAVSLVYTFIRKYYSNIVYYVPDRTDEGYGVTKHGIDHAASLGVSLIIVLDCGVKAVAEVEYAKTKGIDFIICDHHVQDEQLPDAVAILNPKRTDSTYPCAHLSGCGVGFKFMQGFASSNHIDFHHLIPLLDLVAVSIAADIVPVVGENRILAYHGLRQLNSNPRVGFKAIIDRCGLVGKEIQMTDIVFKIGPRINASGRMMCGQESVDLLTEKDMLKATQISDKINLYNEQRKSLDKAMTEEATKLVAEDPLFEEKQSIVIYNKEWHKGVIGIVASRLTEEYRRPTIVMTMNGGLATGSARSYAGFNIYEAIESCRDLLDSFGGHTYAAGLSMEEKYVPIFTKRFEQYVETHIDENFHDSFVDIVDVIDFKIISKKFCHDLKKFAPYGPGNKKPIFATKQVYDYGTSKVVGRGQAHIKLELVDNNSHNVLNGIAFGQSPHIKFIKSKRAFNICYTIEENTYKRGDIQLQIVDIHHADLDEND